jgi:hypothetical protein
MKKLFVLVLFVGVGIYAALGFTNNTIVANVANAIGNEISAGWFRATDESGVSTFAGSIQLGSGAQYNLLSLIPSRTYEKGTSTNGAFRIDNTANDRAAINIYSANGPSSKEALFEINQSNPNFDGGGIAVISKGTNGADFGLKLEGPTPDIEFVDSDEISPEGKFEIDVGDYNSGSALRFNRRNNINTSFEPVLGIGSDAVMIDFDILSLGGLNNPKRLLGQLTVNSNGVSPAILDESNTISVGTGVGGANATNKYLGQFGWVSYDSSFSNPKLVAYISAEATETYSTDSDTGSALTFWTGTNNDTRPTQKMKLGQDGLLSVNGIIKTEPRGSALCASSTEGGIYYDSDDKHFYGCNGSQWVRLDT